MASRRDQLHSYQFMMRRVVSSVLVHETDPEQHPLRRGVGAAFAGVMVAALVAVGFGVYGVISGNQAGRWQTPGAIVIEKETGAQFVYQPDGTLQPVLNFASARLLSAGVAAPEPADSGGLLGGLLGRGSDDSEPKQVASRNLAGLPRAPMVGIPGAPDALPGADRVAGLPWTLCSVLAEDPSGSPTTSTTLVAGDAATGGDVLGERGLLVRDAEAGGWYLIWHSHRYQFTGDDPAQLVRSLYGAAAAPVAVGSAWLNGLPAGQDIGPIRVDGRGDDSSAVSGHPVGSVVFHAVAGGEQHYLVRHDGLAPISVLQLRVLQSQYQVELAEISASAAAAAPASDPPQFASGSAAAPESPPELASGPTETPLSVCAETTDNHSPPVVRLGAALPATGAALPTSGESPEGVRLVDWILVPPGEVAVVRSMPSPNATTGSYQLVTDIGLRHPVPSAEVLGMLGYGTGHAVNMPAALVQRIPAGPTLSPTAAAEPAPVSG